MANSAQLAAVYRMYAESKGKPLVLTHPRPVISNKGQPSGTTGNHYTKRRNNPAASTALRDVPVGLNLWQSTKVGRAKVQHARRCAARSAGPPVPSAPLSCVPKSWVHTFCADGCFHTMVPSDSCGSVECSTCAPKLLSRRSKSAGRRFDGAPLFQIVLTYPDEVVGRIDKETLAALSPIAAAVVDSWLRVVHHLSGRRDILGMEDWPHPTGSAHCRKCGLVAKQGELVCECGGALTRTRPWHPHHNFLVRGQALWLSNDGLLRRRELFPHVQRSDLDALRESWASALEAVFGVRPPAVDVHYSYARRDDEKRRRHIIKYTARTWPGWHRGCLGRVQRRAFGYFRRGWPQFRELLGLDATTGMCACGAPICAELIDCADIRRLCEVRGLVNGRSPPN